MRRRSDGKCFGLQLGELVQGSVLVEEPRIDQHLSEGVGSSRSTSAKT